MSLLLSQEINPSLAESVFSIRENKIFFGDTVIPKADVNTFQVMNAICHGDEDKHCFGKDKERVYYYSRELPNSDPNTFRFLGGGYSSDKKNVYYIMENVFQVVIGANSKTFQVVGSIGSSYAYAKDNNFVYYDGVKIQGSDGKSFGLLKGNKKFEAKDKKYYYIGSEKIPIKRK